MWMISSTICLLAFLLLRHVMKGRVSLQLQYALWVIVALRLLVPFTLGNTTFSFENVRFSSEQNQSSLLEQPMREQSNNTTSLNHLNPQITHQEVKQTIESHRVSNQSDTSPKKIALTVVIKSVWIIGMIGCLLLVSIQNLRFYCRLKRSRTYIGSTANQLQIYMVKWIPSPCLFGIKHPSIYIPSDGIYTEEQKNHIIIHEVTHARHKDHWWAAVRLACLIVHWYNPIVWIGAYLSRQDGELAYDASVIAQLGDEKRHAYGATLLTMSSFSRKQAAPFCGVTTMSFGKREMRERIMHIKKTPKIIISSMVLLMVCIGLIIVCTFTGAKTDSKAAINTESKAVTNTESTAVTNTENPKESKELIPITKAEVTSYTKFGADGPAIDYADNRIVIFHDYFGLFVYDIQQYKIVASLNLNSIGCEATQGDQYCEVMVSKNGDIVYLHPMSESEMYVYQWSEETLEKRTYEQTIISDRFKEFIEINEVVEEINSYVSPLAAVITNSQGEVQYGYLQSTSYAVVDMQYVIGTNRYPVFAEIQLSSKYSSIDNLHLENADKEWLFYYDNQLYARSFSIIDYVKHATEPIGTITELIDAKSIPRNQAETNQKELEETKLWDINEKYAVIECNGVFRLFVAVE